MYAMWSRAAQVQSSCHCKICLHTATTIVRRSTTAASRTRTLPADFFTACYMSILGTATILDAQRKDARRKELDEKLEKAKASVSKLRIQDGPQDTPWDGLYEDNNASSNSTTNDLINPHAPKRKKMRDEWNDSSLLRELSSLCDVTRNITRSTSGRSTWIQNQMDWVRVEATVVAEENNPEIVLREAKSPRQLERTTDATLALIDNLLRQVQRGRGEEEANHQLSKAEYDILNELYDIRTGLYYPSYEQATLQPEEAQSTRALLSESVRRIFNRTSSPIEAVGKICYNLLTSSFPPTIHTYNALIAGFNRIQRPDLAQLVIDSYIRDTAWPATQQTMVCLLNHYRGANNIEGLRDVIARMRGVRDTGLNFSIIHKDAIYTTDWLEWATAHSASRKYAFVERAHRGSDVFDAIIRGWLHHGNVSAASMTFVACIRSGSWIPIQTLHQLFTACLAAVDHSSARSMIKGIVKNLRNFLTMVNSVLRQSTLAMCLKTVDSLSELMRICSLPLQSAFDMVDDGDARSLLQLEYFVSTTKIQLELQASARLCSKVSVIMESPLSLLTRLDGAVKVLNASQWDRKTWENYETIARLLSIEKRAQDLENKGRALANQAKAMIIKRTTGLDLDPAYVLFTRRHESQRQREYFPALSNALESFDLYGDSLTQSNVKAQLVRNIPNLHFVRKLRLAGQSESMCPRVLISFYSPGAVTFYPPDNSYYGRAIKELEIQFLDITDSIKTILFSYLGVERQKKLRTWYPNWYSMPVHFLVDYHSRRQSRDPKSGTKQIPDHDTLIDTQQDSVSTEGPAFGSAVGYKEIGRQLNMAQPVLQSCPPISHIRTRDSMLQFVTTI